VIAPAQPSHAAAMAAIHAAAFPPGETWGAAAMAAQIALPTTFGLIAPAGGMVLARSIGEQAEILTLAVMPNARRRGIARALLQAAAREARRRGARTMFLEVSSANAAARALYAGAGFGEIGRRVRYYSDGTDALILSAPLSSPGSCESAIG
jgi:ribosomal-protein-alanine N-acetyltransferase